MIGPQRPPSTSILQAAGSDSPPAPDEDDSDDFTPALPPSLTRGASQPDSDDDYGPTPATAGSSGSQSRELDGVAEFEEREAARRQRTIDDAKPKVLKRDEWMLRPPTESELLNSMDPTKLKKRGFSQATTAVKASKIDTTLWTETPKERAKRQEDEVLGKKRKTENAEIIEEDEAAKVAEHRRRQRDAEMRQLVNKHNKSSRTETLVDQHMRVSGKEAAEQIRLQNAVWDRDRDMALGGRLMEDGKRKAIIKDAAGLGGKFSSGSFL